MSVSPTSLHNCNGSYSSGLSSWICTADVLVEVPVHPCEVTVRRTGPYWHTLSTGYADVCVTSLVHSTAMFYSARFCYVNGNENIH